MFEGVRTNPGGLAGFSRQHALMLKRLTKFYCSCASRSGNLDQCPTWKSHVILGIVGEAVIVGTANVFWWPFW